MKSKVFRTCFFLILFMYFFFGLSFVSNKVSGGGYHVLEPGFTELEGDFINDQALYSMKINYRLDYTLSTGTTKSYDVPFGFGYSYGTVYNQSGDVSYKYVYGDSTSTITYNNVYVMLPASAEIILRCSNYYLTSLTIVYGDLSETEPLIVCDGNDNNYDTNLDAGEFNYDFPISKLVNELHLKNETTSSITPIKQITCEYSSVEYTDLQYAIKKDRDKNICSLQTIGRITRGEYNTIGNNCDTTRVYFGLIYGKDTGEFKLELTACKNALNAGNTYSGTYVNLINEVPYSSLKGYDSDGFVINQLNPTYYQWGVSINYISDNNLKVGIVSIPYIRYVDINGRYNVIYNASDSHSIKDLAATYGALDNSNIFEKLFLQELGK